MDSIGVEMFRLFAVILVGYNVITFTDALQEVCNAEDFNAQCGRREIIIMKSAYFGRMRLGNCITMDLGYLGCQYSVVGKLDILCSAKTECRMRKIVTKDFEDSSSSNPCPDGLELYLEADYECVKGTLPVAVADLSSTYGNFEYD
ncbi:hypothetical protein CAPTEDRAFT_197651 [Capitella teleta]|uniref:SUEL-type lectin domain-containing protein n=1 Tax=Capitella teleta TaxID=283909 RepID=R7VL71_CAPTE|nr:hypothetical protein CAPTEDRAFT_197651 [Capitella teleta]|eukprot:ELU18011.1 hypothetical protein CAPTEDRAFT_197651 [Capitella teleta]